MSTLIPTNVNTSTDVPVHPEMPRYRTGLARILAIMWKMLIAAAGLALGGFLGLLIGLFSGLIDFSC
ncbi:hypothetical protein [Paraherbaspirillum soli]|uniref:Uncharacterized protein n=1 Tax=Paraherbaspirillum soli TaxID=631222 RepID=A0ABW0M944_9BURK